MLGLNVLLFLACKVVLLKCNRSVFQSASKELVIAFIIKSFTIAKQPYNFFPSPVLRAISVTTALQFLKETCVILLIFYPALFRRHLLSAA